MTWHYRIRKRVFIGEPWYDIVEFYHMRPSGWTKDGMTPGGSTRQEVIENLEMMLRDAKKYRTLVDKEKG